jgi:hypothetical protein
VTKARIDGLRIQVYYSSIMPYQPSFGPRLREARLLPGAAARCPWASAGIWVPAGTLADEARRHSPPDGGPESGRRALSEESFEFRGGLPELALRRGARTRWTDHPTPASSRRPLPTG